MPDDQPKPGSTNWLIVALMTAQTGLLSWTLTTIADYQKESKAERTLLLEHVLHASQSAEKAEKVAESTKTVVDSTKKAVESTQKEVVAVKKAVSESQQ